MLYLQTSATFANPNEIKIICHNCDDTADVKKKMKIKNFKYASFIFLDVFTQIKFNLII